MDPFTIAALLGITVQAASSLIGEANAAKDKREEMRLLGQTLRDYEGLSLPELKELQAEQLGRSGFEDIQADPAARAAQYQALEQLQQIARSGGATLEDKANLSRFNQGNARNASAGNARIASEMQARGQYGGGQQLAIQLANQQGAAQRGANAGLDQAAQAQRRGMDAILQGGRMGGDLRSQGFDEQARTAQAKDMVSRYNADARAGAARYNAQLPQQQFSNQMAIVQGKAGARGQKAGQHARNADDTRALAAGVGAAAQRGGTTAANQFAYGQSQSPLEDAEALRRRGGR